MPELSKGKKGDWPYEASIVRKVAGTFAIEARRIKIQSKSDKKPPSWLEPYPFQKNDIKDTYIVGFKGDYIMTRKGNKISPIGRRGDKADFRLTLWFAKYYDGD